MHKNKAKRCLSVFTSLLLMGTWLLTGCPVPPNGNTNDNTANRPVCGDGDCTDDETCTSCATDCNPCIPDDGGDPPPCGDGNCLGDETCTNCRTDCGDCAPVCGDGDCAGDETCTSCATDCGPCLPPDGPTCGDGDCAGDETCTNCRTDCGDCDPVDDGIEPQLSVSCIGSPSPATVGDSISWTAIAANSDGSAVAGAVFCWGGSCNPNPWSGSDGNVTGTTAITTSVAVDGLNSGNVQVMVGERATAATCSVTASASTSPPPPPPPPPPQTFTLTVNLDRENEQGIVIEGIFYTNGIPSHAEIACPEVTSLDLACSATYASGYTVYLLRYAPAGYGFVGWEGDVGTCANPITFPSGPDGPPPLCPIIMDANKTVTGVFRSCVADVNGNCP